MSLRSKWKKLTILPRTLVSPPRCIFIVGHMRSRSSLLAHILGSNPQIHGYVERHRSYVNGRKLFKFVLESMTEAEDPSGKKYALDKILNNACWIAPEIVRSPQIRYIILVRQPRATIESIVRMGALMDIDRYHDPEQAIDYYCQRLGVLLGYAELLQDKAFFVESDDLLDAPAGTLGNLSNWLELDTPLESSYDLFEKTGKPHFGDMSPNINLGRIVRNSHPPNDSLPTDSLAPAWTAYRRLVKMYR